MSSSVPQPPPPSSSLLSRKRPLDETDDEEEYQRQASSLPPQQIRQSIVAAMRSNNAFVFVSHDVDVSSGDPRLNIRPRILSCPSGDVAIDNANKCIFIQEFRDHIVDLVRELRRDFPYQHTIEWKMEYGPAAEHHTLHIAVKRS